MTHDPYLDPRRAEELNVEIVSLEELFRESDFVAVNCPLSDETRGMVDARLFGLMKSGAFFINTARGPMSTRRTWSRRCRAARSRARAWTWSSRSRCRWTIR